MKIQLTKEECEAYFYNVLCNGLGYFCSSYGFEWECEGYKDAKDRLIKKGIDPCLEDVIMEALRGGSKLELIDGEGLHNGEITLEKVYDWLPETDSDHLLDMINEHDDAVTADVILQTIAYEGEVIFG